MFQIPWHFQVFQTSGHSELPSDSLTHHPPTTAAVLHVLDTSHVMSITSSLIAYTFINRLASKIQDYRPTEQSGQHDYHRAISQVVHVKQFLHNKNWPPLHQCLKQVWLSTRIPSVVQVRLHADDEWQRCHLSTAATLNELKDWILNVPSEITRKPSYKMQLTKSVPT